MEQKLLKIFKLANKLDEKQNEVYAEINYIANGSKKIEFIIRSKKDFSYIEKSEIMVTDNSERKWDNIITLFETFVGGIINE